jgi:uncharacterized repeat protein (TIGR03847 family)
MDVIPEVFTADYVGEPGKRTFFLQVRADVESHSFLVEKEQVHLLADKLREFLVAIDAQDAILGAQPERDPALALAPVDEPEWRVGNMALAYDEDADRFVLFVDPIQPDDDDEREVDEPEVGESEKLRVLLRRDQVRAFVLHAIAVVSEGRPICQLCGLPMDPTGHLCPASNGHRTAV